MPSVDKGYGRRCKQTAHIHTSCLLSTADRGPNLKFCVLSEINILQSHTRILTKRDGKEGWHELLNGLFCRLG